MGFDAADRAALLDEDMPGYALATYDGTAAVAGLFRAVPSVVLGLVGGSEPAFLCEADDLAADPRGKTLVVNGTSYTIRDATPDGRGFVSLQLEAA